MKKNGFTLVELLVVLTIMSLMATVIVPSIVGSYRKQLLSSITEEVLSNLRWAQQLGQMEETMIEVAFYQEGKKQYYEVVAKEGRYEGEVYRQIQLPNGNMFDFNGTKVVIFNRDGSIKHNGHFTFSVRGDKRYVYFYQTGRMRISSTLNEG